MSFNMYIPTRVLFGAGELNNLHTQKMPESGNVCPHAVMRCG